MQLPAATIARMTLPVKIGQKSCRKGDPTWTLATCVLGASPTLSEKKKAPSARALCFSCFPGSLHSPDVRETMDRVSFISTQ